MVRQTLVHEFEVFGRSVEIYSKSVLWLKLQEVPYIGAGVCLRVTTRASPLNPVPKRRHCGMRRQLIGCCYITTCERKTLRSVSYKMDTAPPPPQWVLDLNSPPVAKKNAAIPDPPGFTSTSVGGKVSKLYTSRAADLPVNADARNSNPLKSPSARLLPAMKWMS